MGSIDYWIYWLLAYTAGIACLITVLFAHFQQRRSRIDIAFFGTLNLFTILFVVSEYLLYVSPDYTPQSLVIRLFASDHPLVFCCLTLIYLAPLWSHSKKTRTWPRRAQKAVGWFCLSLGFIYIGTILLGGALFVSFVIFGVLLIMVLYISSVLFFCPTARNPRYGLRIEKTYAVVNVLFLPFLLLFDTYYRELTWLQRLVPIRIYSFPLYYLGLCMVGSLESILGMTHPVERNETAPSKNETSEPISNRIVDTYGLTPREMEIIELLSAGHSYAEIGEKLFISHSTVKTHIQRIYRKTNVSNKIQLVNLIRT